VFLYRYKSDGKVFEIGQIKELNVKEFEKVQITQGIIL